MPALTDLPRVLRPLLPGLLLSVTIAAAAGFLADHYGAPAMLFALLIGIAFNFLHEESTCRAGVDFAARTLLRLGVGLLGLRIALDDLAQFGWTGAAVIAGLVALTIATGFVVAPLLGRGWRFALLTGGAVAICGASAALGLAPGIPANENTERNTLFTVMAVTTLSTIAMVAYPILFQTMDLSDIQRGFLIGVTIHDVAQVVGAGFSISDSAGETATIAKLFRVALLPVVLVAVVLSLRISGAGTAGGKVPLLPWFMVLFLVLSATGSAIDLPASVTGAVSDASRLLLVTAIAALGVKTSMRAMREVGPGHLGVVVIETLVLLGAALLLLGFVPLV
ncbi:MAG: YeiH family protein [Pseudorhodobacter sp.]